MSERINLNWVKNASLKDEGLHPSSLDWARKIIIQILFTLDTAVSDFTDLLRVKFFPRLAIQIFVKGNYENGVDKIDKGVPDIAIVLQVHW